MLALGDRLRDARLRRGLTLEQAQAATRIRAVYLAALEEEDFDALPGDAYAKGFLRSYADWLGLDGAALVAELRERLREVELPIAPEPERIPGPPLGRLAAFAAFVLVVATAVGLVGWKLAPSGERASPEQTLPAETAPTATTPKPKPAATPKPTPRAKAIVIAATAGDCWLQVRLGNAHGKVIWVGTLQQGQRLRFGLKRGLRLLVGNPDALRVTLDGRRARLPAGPRWQATPTGLRTA